MYIFLKKQIGKRFAYKPEKGVTKWGLRLVFWGKGSVGGDLGVKGGGLRGQVLGFGGGGGRSAKGCFCGGRRLAVLWRMERWYT